MHLSSWHNWVDISSWIAESRLQDSNTKWPLLTPEAIGGRMLCGSCMQNEILDSLARYVPCCLLCLPGFRLPLIGFQLLPGFSMSNSIHDHHYCDAEGYWCLYACSVYLCACLFFFVEMGFLCQRN